jgi:hypothetical protein
LASEVLNTTAAAVFVDDHGLLHIVSNGIQSTAETVRETFAAARSLLTAPAPTLFDARNWPRAGAGFWVTFIDLLPGTVSAGAILVEPAGRADLGGFPEAVNRLMVPFDVFTDEAEAKAFLMHFIPTVDESE